MHPYPHLYEASAEGAPVDVIQVTSAGLPAIATTPPPQFDGPEGSWSPETLLCASVADCLILTFRAIARASKLAAAKGGSFRAILKVLGRCLLYTSPSPRDRTRSRMPSSA